MSDVRAPITAALAGLALLLVVVNIALELTDEGAQAEINQRQAFINQNAEVMRIDNALIRALATAAATGKDARIDDALKRAGVTYTFTPPPAQSAPAPATH